MLNKKDYTLFDHHQLCDITDRRYSHDAFAPEGIVERADIKQSQYYSPCDCASPGENWDNFSSFMTVHTVKPSTHYSSTLLHPMQYFTASKQKASYI